MTLFGLVASQEFGTRFKAHGLLARLDMRLGLQSTPGSPTRKKNRWHKDPVRAICRVPQLYHRPPPAQATYHELDESHVFHRVPSVANFSTHFLIKA
ncbi:hypothetical protein MY10362_000939 [Beauveria mimosiformis]